MSDLAEKLVEDLINKQVIPFIGAGVSMSVKKSPLEPEIDENGKEKKDILGNTKYKSLFPSWREFLLNAADKLDRNNESEIAEKVRDLLNNPTPDYLEVAQLAFDGLGRRLWNELLSENFDIDIESADQDSLKLAKLIWQFGSKLVLTTNIDLVLESVHEKPNSVKILDTQASGFADIIRDWNPKHPTVLHLHGSIDDKDHIIFTKEDYDNFYNKKKNKAKLDTLHTIFSQRTILFIGFSLVDLFILKELEKVNVIFKGGASAFYVLVQDSAVNNPHIPSYVKKIKFSEIGKPLEDKVQMLTQIKSEREKLIIGLPGRYEYKCKVKSGSTFDGRQTERGGYMDIEVYEDSYGSLKAKINAKRLWAKNADGEEPFLLDEGITWTGNGHIESEDKVKGEDGILIFIYQIIHENAEGEGKAEDSFEITNEFSLKYGTFTHWFEGGKSQRIEGKVEVNRITNNQDFQWMPKK